jgi:hypothetical protein
LRSTSHFHGAGRAVYTDGLASDGAISSSDSFSEELINALARLNGLRVVARTSSFCFRRAAAPPQYAMPAGGSVKARTVSHCALTTGC